MGARWQYDAFKGTKKLISHKHTSKFELGGFVKNLVPSIPKAEGRLILPSGGLGGVISSAKNIGRLGGPAVAGGAIGASLNKAGSTIAAFPQGAGFGLGYGVGVRIGYEGLFPNIKAGNYPGVSRAVLGLIPGFNLGSEGFWAAGEQEKRGKSAKFPGLPKVGVNDELRSFPATDTGTPLRNPPSFIGPPRPAPSTGVSGAELHWFQEFKKWSAVNRQSNPRASSGYAARQARKGAAMRPMNMARNWIQTNSSIAAYQRWVLST